jgi:NTP pyrophosphatase (non-canonical NTP hydrolase)
MRPLTFDEFRAANRARCMKWHPRGIYGWSDSDWLVAIMGELGELASLIKMRNRERDGLPGNKFSPTEEQLAYEAADVFTYLDLFCERNGIDLGVSAAQKFNVVSERVGFPDRIVLREDEHNARSSANEEIADLRAVLETTIALYTEELRKVRQP